MSCHSYGRRLLLVDTPHYMQRHRGIMANELHGHGPFTLSSEIHPHSQWNRSFAAYQPLTDLRVFLTCTTQCLWTAQVTVPMANRTVSCKGYILPHRNAGPYQIVESLVLQSPCSPCNHPALATARITVLYHNNHPVRAP